MIYSYTIIIPHKNIPLLLTRCINSIPERDDIQIIVVDDNSEGAEAYISKYPELSRPNLELHLTKEGKGAGYARNVGMKHAKGKWLLFADADDFFLDGCLDVLDKYVESDVDVVGFPIRCCLSDNLGDEIDSSWYNKAFDDVRNSKLSERDLFFGANFPWAKMVNRDFLITSNITFEEVPYANDVSWGYHVAAEYKMATVSDKPIYCLTTREGSLTRKKDYETLIFRYNVHKRAVEYACSKGYQRFKLPIAVDYLTWFRELGIGSYLKFLKSEGKELLRSKGVEIENKPRNYKFPFLYALWIAFSVKKIY